MLKLTKLFKKHTLTTEELVKEIHENFFTEVDRLLEGAKVTHSLRTDKQDLIDKSERLRNVGFVNAEGTYEAREEIKRLDNLKRENKRKQDLIDAIQYFSSKYPHYRFITEESVLKICEKYNLVYGEVSRYKGTVPDINLRHIEQFKIDKEDQCYYLIDSRGNVTSYVSYDYHERRIDRDHLYTSPRHIPTKCSLEIAAPLGDFNTTNMELKNFKLSSIKIPDPVVLKPVFWKDTKHYLIVTAWGEEASDEMIVNSKMN